MASTTEYPSSFYRKISIPRYSSFQAEMTAAHDQPVQTVLPGTKFDILVPHYAAPAGHTCKQLTQQLFNHVMGPSTVTPLFDDSQVGQILGFEIATDNPYVNLQIGVYADNPTIINYLNNFRMFELLSLGRGLSPGDVSILPNGQGQDIPGRPSQIYPYLARFKFDNQPDFTSQFSSSLIGFSGNVIVLKFEPSTAVPYNRIIANLINSDPVNSANVITLDVKRMIHEDLGPTEVEKMEVEAFHQQPLRRTVEISSPNYGSSVSGSSKPSSDEIQYES